MTTLTFSDNELNELKNFYQFELDKAVKRVEDIKGIIQKFSGQTTEHATVTQTSKAKSKPRGFAAIPKTKVKQIASMGGKSSHGGGRPKGNSPTKTIPWRKFIPQLIKKEGSMTIHDIANAAMAKFNYPDKDKLLRTLSPTLTRMSKLGKLTFDRKPGQKTHLFSLPALTKTKNKTETTEATNGAAALTQ